MCSVRRGVTWIRSSRFPCLEGVLSVCCHFHRHWTQSSESIGEVAEHDHQEQAWDGVQAPWIPSSSPLYLLLWARIPLKKWRSHHSQQKSLECSAGCNLKNDRMISVCFQGKPFNITIIQVYAPTTNPEEVKAEWYYEDLQYLPELTPKKRWPFHHRELECKSRKSRDTWSNMHIWPWSTEWSRAKANRVLSRDRIGHCKHPLPTTQEITLHMNITSGQYWNQTDYILCSWRWRGSIQSVKTRLGAHCGSNHELFMAKFRLTLKKIGKPLDHSGMT